MSSLRTIRKLLLGETWILPAGVAAVLVSGGAIRAVAAGMWADLGGAILVIGVLAVLFLGVHGSLRRRVVRPNEHERPANAGLPESG